MTASSLLHDLLGYRLDMIRFAALRALHRRIDGTGLRPADTTALILASEQPGVDQTTLGRSLGRNRAIGMKVASRLAAKGLLERSAGRDLRSKGLFLTAQGKSVLADMLDRHRNADAAIARGLDRDERLMLVSLLDKLARALDEDDRAWRSGAAGTSRAVNDPRGTADD